MNKPKKKFDAVAMMRENRDRISSEIAGNDLGRRNRMASIAGFEGSIPQSTSRQGYLETKRSENASATSLIGTNRGTPQPSKLRPKPQGPHGIN